MTGTPEAEIATSPPPGPITVAEATAAARLALLGTYDAKHAWTIITREPWREKMVPRGTIPPVQAARYVYLRMGNPRTMARLKAGMKYLGFARKMDSTLREWRAQGGWVEEAAAYDLGIMSIREMKERLATIRRNVLIPMMESLSETLSMALDAETMEKAIRIAAEKGDFKGLVEGAQKVMAEMNILTGEIAPTPVLHQHQHLHAHGDAAGVPAAAGGVAALASPAERVFAKLDAAAESKRLSKPAVEATAKEVTP